MKIYRVVRILVGAVVLVVISCFVVVLLRRAHRVDPVVATPPAVLATYTNTALGFSLTHPTSWVQHDAPYAGAADILHATPAPDASRVILGPPRIPDCYPITFAQHDLRLDNPLVPIDIDVREGTLAKVRAGMLRVFGGQDYIESEIVLTGKPAYLYTPRFDNSPCDDGSPYQFRSIITEHRGKVLEITTHDYAASTTRAVIDSIVLQ